MIQAHEAKVSITHRGQNFDLPDPVHVRATDGDIRAWATEAIRAGTIPGVVADPRVNLTGYVVDRFDPLPGQRDYNLIQVRPKTAYG